MIVVGVLGPDSGAVGEIARRAATLGANVELLGVVPGDATWDRHLFELGQAGVGHATVIRAGRSTLDPADLDLALRYLPDIRCIVLAQPPARLISTALAGADFAGAPLVLVGPVDEGVLAAIERHSSSAAPGSGATGPPGPGATGSGGSGATGSGGSAGSAPIVLDPPTHDPDGTFAGFVAALAARLDAGDPPEDAFRSTVVALAVDRR